MESLRGTAAGADASTGPVRSTEGTIGAAAGEAARDPGGVAKGKTSGARRARASRAKMAGAK
eukprot:12503882-Alexandrium_andersonii.AAC.1